MAKNIKAPVRGYKRQYVRCKECKNVAYYDYIPFSLSNPVMTQPCGHGLTLRPNEKWDYISEEEGLKAMSSRQNIPESAKIHGEAWSYFHREYLAGRLSDADKTMAWTWFLRGWLSKAHQQDTLRNRR